MTWLCLKVEKILTGRYLTFLIRKIFFIYADTSRQPREGEENGKGYNFASREEIEADIRAGKYLEHGDYEGNLYGTKVDSIREVMRSGKMCLLDVNPTVRAAKLFFRMSW